MTTNYRKFVIQEHTSTQDTHWDFMLQTGDSLQTWRLDKPPRRIISQRTVAIKIFDHPLKFLTYEGPVNKGKGSVQIAETGTYQIIYKDENQIELNLTGRILNGKFTLTCLEEENWELSPQPQSN